MSEREVRRLLKHHHANHDEELFAESGSMRCDCQFCKRGDKALAATPDVVEVALKIVEETCKGTLSPEQVWAVGLIKQWMEKTFKFRLTDDGYEYTEETTDVAG